MEYDSDNKDFLLGIIGALAVNGLMVLVNVITSSAHSVGLGNGRGVAGLRCGCILLREMDARWSLGASSPRW